MEDAADDDGGIVMGVLLPVVIVIEAWGWWYGDADHGYRRHQKRVC